MYSYLHIHTDTTLQAFNKSKQQSISQDCHHFTCKMLSTCASRLVSKAYSSDAISICTLYVNGQGQDSGPKDNAVV